MRKTHTSDGFGEGLLQAHLTVLGSNPAKKMSSIPDLNAWLQASLNEIEAAAIDDRLKMSLKLTLHRQYDELVKDMLLK